MTHCLDFYRKWKRDQNFCGLRKQEAKDIDTYLSIVEKISGNGAGVDSDFVFDHFTAGAARPLIRCKDPEASTKAMNYVIACLKRGEDVTGGDLDATIKVFTGKSKEKPVPESTQMRNPDTLQAPIDETPAQSLADRERQKEMEEAGKNQQSEKDLTIVKECRTAQTDPVFVNPGPTVMVNPVVINDTHRQSPFVTAAQLKAGEVEPAEIGPNMAPLPAPAEDMKTKRIRLADELLECLSERFQMSVRDYIQYNHQNGERTAFDVLYMGAEQMINKPKAPASSSGATMRRA